MEEKHKKISIMGLKTNKKPLIIFLVVAFIVMTFGEIYLNNQILKSGLSWFIAIGFFVFLIYWKCILPKSIKNTSLVITLILSLIITPIAIIIVAPVFVLFEGVEPPDWTAEIAAILIIGACVGIWRYLYFWLEKPLEKVLRRVGINR